MPGWQTVEWGGFRIFAEPVGWRRNNRILKFLPYLYGTKPKFSIVFERLNTPDQNTQFNWFLRFSNGLETGHDITLPQLQPGTIHKEPAGHRLLGLTGDTILGIRQHLGAPAFHTLYSFRIVALEDLILSILIAFVAVILAYFVIMQNGG